MIAKTIGLERGSSYYQTQSCRDYDFVISAAVVEGRELDAVTG